MGELVELVDDPVEALSSVTLSLTFDGSTGGCGLGVPPEQHPASGQVRQSDETLMLVDQLEGGCRLSLSQHASSLPECSQSTRMSWNWPCRVRPARTHLLVSGGTGHGYDQDGFVDDLEEATADRLVQEAIQDSVVAMAYDQDVCASGGDRQVLA